MPYTRHHRLVRHNGIESFNFIFNEFYRNYLWSFTILKIYWMIVKYFKYKKESKNYFSALQGKMNDKINLKLTHKYLSSTTKLMLSRTQFQYL